MSVSKKPFKCPNFHAIKWKRNSSRSNNFTKNKSSEIKFSRMITAIFKESTSNHTLSLQKTTTRWYHKFNSSKKSLMKSNAIWNKSKSKSSPVSTKICSGSNLSLKCKGLISKQSIKRIDKLIGSKTRLLNWKGILKYRP